MHPLANVIYDAPDDPAGYAVFTDWLLENGDPFGRVAAEQRPRKQQAYEKEWLAPFVEKGLGRCVVTWEHGFIRRMEISTRRGPELLAKVSQSHATRFIRELELVSYDWVASTPLEGLALPRSLRKVSINGNALRAAEHMDHLEDLTVGGPFDKLRHARVRALRLLAQSGAWKPALTASEVPALESLWLWKRLSELGDLDVPGAPNLAHLRIENWNCDTGPPENAESWFASELWALASSPLVRRLRSVRLGYGIAPAAVRPLINVVPMLAHLECIRIEAPLRLPAPEELRALLGARLVWGLGSD